MISEQCSPVPWLLRYNRSTKVPGELHSNSSHSMMTLQAMTEARQEFADFIRDLLETTGLQVVYCTSDVVRLTDGGQAFDLHWEFIEGGWAVRVGKHPTIGFDKMKGEAWVCRLGSCFLTYHPVTIATVINPQFSYQGCLQKWPILAEEQ